MKVVSTSNAPAAIGPYSQAIDLGNMVFVSGQIPVDPATGKMADTVEEQAAQSLANLKAILAEAGLPWQMWSKLSFFWPISTILPL